MKKVALLGGTFDPPHFGHLLIANEVCFQLQLDEVWFLPNQIPPHKVKMSQTTNEHRIDMLTLAIHGHPQFRIEKIELTRTGPSYTIDTMHLLTKQYPTHKFYFIIGADMIEYLPKWYKIHDLIDLVQFIGVKRPGYEADSIFPIIMVDTPEMGISSKLIRKRIENKESIRYLLPESVRLYIEENQLYES